MSSMTKATAPAAVSQAQRSLPAWPVAMLLGLFPLWWVLGLLPFISLIMSAVMLAFLIRSRAVLLVPGVLPWLAFTAWTLASAVMLDSGLRLVGYGLRVGQWAAAAVVLVYIVNARHSLPVRRLVFLLMVLWATTVIGGLIGMFSPDVRLVTPTGLLLPNVLTSNEYVQDLVFPSLAEVQQPWGAPEPFIRPSAPFTYANSWGAAWAILTPVALAAISLARSRRVRLMLAVGIIVSIVPAVATSNRGMFLALTVTVAYAAIRFAGRGHFKAMLALLMGGFLTFVALYSLGAVAGIASRQETSNTTQGRASLYLETLHRTLESPILGFGGPRPSLTAEISVGTQGQFWFVVFSFGFVGLVLYLLFLWGAAIRTYPAPTTHELWLHSVLVGASVMILYYGLDSTMQLVVVVIAGALLRERYLPAVVASDG